MVTTLALCAFGLLQTFAGTDAGETCTLVEQERFGVEYWAAHRSGLLPPYRAPCNADHDLVPGWVNPAIAAGATLSAVCGAAPGTSRRIDRRRSVTGHRAAGDPL
ncbi:MULTISPECIES: hypothetical protein [unclassified Geodermatophilus]